jgi:hypothetical protein
MSLSIIWREGSDFEACAVDKNITLGARPPRLSENSVF